MSEADAAWVRVRTDFAAGELLAFLREDPARLLRLNPLLEFDRLEAAGEALRLRGRNRGNGRSFDAAARVAPLADGLRLEWADGLKAATTFRVNGSELVVTDDYGRLPPHERQARLDEVDNSLVPWGHALFRHLQSRRRWGTHRLWRWWTDGVWLRMRPRSRRLTAIFALTTLVELALLLLLVAILWAEGRT